MQLLRSSIKVFLLIGMTFLLASCLTVEEEEDDDGGALPTSWYEDSDGDTFGDPGTEVVGDQPLPTWVTDDTDCDDDNPNANPSELEIADRVDNDCDGEVDNGFKYAFITSTIHDGNLGGLAGADKICDDLAAAVTDPLPLPEGNYVAWLSSLAGNAIDRVTDNPDNTSTYVFTDGAVIADGFRNFIKGDTAINIDELMGGVGSTSHVWTDTGDDGLIVDVAKSCSEWASSSGDGIFGNAGSTGESWTNIIDDECQNAKLLYCIQY